MPDDGDDWWAMIESAQEVDPFESYHRGTGIRRMLVGGVAALLVVAAFSLVLVVLGTPERVVRAAQALQPPMTRSSADLVPPQVVTVDQPIPAWSRRILDLQRHPAELHAGDCIALGLTNSGSDADVLWVVPCDYPNAIPVHGVLMLPDFAGRPDLLRQFVFERCFASATSSTAAEVAWVGEGDSGVFVLTTAPKIYVALRYPDGLLICTVRPT